jgi:hypothetical protein
MISRRCPFEQELTQELKAGHWPDGCSPEQRAHVAGCRECGELVLVMSAFQGARSEVVHEVRPGTPELLWWRAQLRRRNLAASRVSKPITVAQTFAWLISILVAIGFAASQYSHGLSWSSWSLPSSKALHLLSLDSSDWHLLPWVAALGLIAMLSGVVLFLTSEKS